MQACFTRSRFHAAVTMTLLLLITVTAAVEEPLNAQEEKLFQEAFDNLTRALAAGTYAFSDPENIIGGRARRQSACEEVYRNLNNGVPFGQVSLASQNLGSSRRRTRLFVQRLNLAQPIASVCNLDAIIVSGIVRSRTVDVFFRVWLADGPDVSPPLGPTVSPGPGTYVGGGMVPNVVLPAGPSEAAVSISLSLPISEQTQIFVGLYVEGFFPRFSIVVSPAVQAALVGMGTRGPPSVGNAGPAFLTYSPATHDGPLSAGNALQGFSLPGRALAFAAGGSVLMHATE